MTSTSSDSTKKKRSPISLPFVVFCLVVLGIGYFRGEWIMTQVMYLQEHFTLEAKKKASSDGVKSSPDVPGVPAKGGLIPPEEVPNSSTEPASTEPASTEPPADSASETKADPPSPAEIK